MSRLFTTMWSNFVKVGAPTPPGGQGEVDWRPVSEAQGQYLRIQTEPRMEQSQDYRERMDFWYKLLGG